MEIKKINRKHLDCLQKISIQTFEETFAEYNKAEDIHQYLTNCLSKKQLLLELKNKQSEFYFIKDKQNILGYLKLNYGAAQTELRKENTIEIERIYVIKKFQSKGIGKLLLNKSVARAEHLKADYIWLGVWEKNRKAIDFYHKNGFIDFDQHTFYLGSDKQTDVMMKLKLLN